jgi:hypothetical protein
MRRFALAFYYTNQQLTAAEHRQERRREPVGDNGRAPFAVSACSVYNYVCARSVIA